MKAVFVFVVFVCKKCGSSVRQQCIPPRDADEVHSALKTASAALQVAKPAFSGVCIAAAITVRLNLASRACSPAPAPPDVAAARPPLLSRSAAVASTAADGSLPTQVWLSLASLSAEKTAC